MGSVRVGAEHTAGHQDLDGRLLNVHGADLAAGSLVAFYGNYAEFAQAQDNVENAVIAFKGNTVVMVIASNECTADLDSAVDSALAD